MKHRSDMTHTPIQLSSADIHNLGRQSYCTAKKSDRSTYSVVLDLSGVSSSDALELLGISMRRICYQTCSDAPMTVWTH